MKLLDIDLDWFCDQPVVQISPSIVRIGALHSPRMVYVFVRDAKYYVTYYAAGSVSNYGLVVDDPLTAYTVIQQGLHPEE